MWVGCADEWGSAPAWVTLKQADPELRIIDVAGGMCPDQLDNPGLIDVCTHDITGTDYMGSVFATWDGCFRHWDAVGECWYREAAALGDYVAEVSAARRAWQLGQRRPLQLCGTSRSNPQLEHRIRAKPRQSWPQDRYLRNSLSTKAGYPVPVSLRSRACSSMLARLSSTTRYSTVVSGSRRR